MVGTSTLSAIHQICADTHLAVNVKELSTLLGALGVLSTEEQKQVTWAAIGMAVANANKTTDGSEIDRRECEKEVQI